MRKKFKGSLKLKKDGQSFEHEQEHDTPPKAKKYPKRQQKLKPEKILPLLLEIEDEFSDTSKILRPQSQSEYQKMMSEKEAMHKQMLAELAKQKEEEEVFNPLQYCAALLDDSDIIDQEATSDLNDTTTTSNQPSVPVAIKSHAANLDGQSLHQGESKTEHAQNKNEVKPKLATQQPVPVAYHDGTAKQEGVAGQDKAKHENAAKQAGAASQDKAKHENAAKQVGAASQDKAKHENAAKQAGAASQDKAKHKNAAKQAGAAKTAKSQQPASLGKSLEPQPKSAGGQSQQSNPAKKAKQAKAPALAKQSAKAKQQGAGDKNTAKVVTKAAVKAADAKAAVKAAEKPVVAKQKTVKPDPKAGGKAACNASKATKSKSSSAAQAHAGEVHATSNADVSDKSQASKTNTAQQATAKPQAQNGAKVSANLQPQAATHKLEPSKPTDSVKSQNKGDLLLPISALLDSANDALTQIVQVISDDCHKLSLSGELKSVDNHLNSADSSKSNAPLINSNSKEDPLAMSLKYKTEDNAGTPNLDKSYSHFEDESGLKLTDDSNKSSLSDHCQAHSAIDLAARGYVGSVNNEDKSDELIDDSGLSAWVDRSIAGFSSEDDTNLEYLLKRQIAASIVEDLSREDFIELLSELFKAQGCTTLICKKLGLALPELDLLVGGGFFGFGGAKIGIKINLSPITVDRMVLDEFVGLIKKYQADYGILISLRGFKTSYQPEYYREFFKIHFWDMQNVVDNLIDHYDQLSPRAKNLLPLQQIWVLDE